MLLSFPMENQVQWESKAGEANGGQRAQTTVEQRATPALIQAENIKTTGGSQLIFKEMFSNVLQEALERRQWTESQ